MKTSELIGPALDWAVAKCEGWSDEGLEDIANGDKYPEHDFSTDWAQGGPLIERERIGVYQGDKERDWSAQAHGWLSDPLRRYPFVRGPTPLIAAMRCYVASKLGDEVVIPSGL
jgi:Protein of unknown function (DUF2591)